VIFGIRIRTLARICFAVGIIIVVMGSLNPQPAILPLRLSDKLVHILAYAILGIVGSIGYPNRSMTAVLIGGLTVLGGAIEIAQIYIPGRDGTLLDVLANALGSVLGVAGGRQFKERP